MTRYVCPECNGEAQLVTAADGGAIDEPVITTRGQLGRRVRPATFVACGSCEWCAELRDVRERGDDDGQEYADPRDEREERRG